MTDNFNFTWNYRIVNATIENGGDDWYCLREVYYDDLGKLIGHAAPCLGAEDMDGFKDVWHMVMEALTLPPLQEDDFTTKETEA
jgi:hypothetical protein